MSYNLLHEVKAKLVFRLDIDFQIETKTVDNWIGRTAHIKMLDCLPFLQMLVARYRVIFN